MTLKQHRLFQWFIITLLLLAGTGAYFYYHTKAATNEKRTNNNGLVGYWSFDEGSGTKAGDASGNSSTGTLTNGPTWTTGVRGNALTFDGANDYVDMGDVADMGTSGFTLSVWFKTTTPSAPSAAYGLIGKSAYADQLGRYGIFIYRGNLAALFDGNGAAVEAATSETPYIDGRWHLATVTYLRSGNMTLYVDGVSKSTRNISADSGTNMQNANKFYIGVYQDAGGTTPRAGTYFNGSVDEVRVFSRALSSGEVTSLYRLGAAKLAKNQSDQVTNGLVGYWSLNGSDISGTTAYDRSGQGNNGTLTNGPVAAIGKVGQALSFDGVDDYIVSGSSLNMSSTDKVSISMWVKLASSSTQILMEQSTSFNSNNAFMVDESEYGTPGSLQFNDRNGGYNIAYTSNAYNDNWWHHFVAVSDRSLDGLSQVTLYVDGVQDTVHHAAYREDISGNYGTYPLYIGSRSGSSYFFNGSMDEVRIYNRALSASEVQSLYDLGTPATVNGPEDSFGSSGLVGYWSFNGKDISGTTAYDRSGQGNNGTLINGPAPIMGKVGQALSFDGADDYVSVNTTAGSLGSNNQTICAWVQPSSTAKAIVVSKTDPGVAAMSFFINSDHSGNASPGSWGFGLVGSGPSYLISAVESNVISVGQWTHLCAARTGPTTMSLYRNGVLDSPTWTTSSNVTELSSGTFYIGTRMDVNGFYFPGSIDEVRIYNRALSASEVTALYNAGR